MADNEIHKRVQGLLGLYSTSLSNLAAWNQLAPRMQETHDYLAHVDHSLSQSPSAIRLHNDEVLIDYLDKAERDAKSIGFVAMPTSGSGSAITTGGTAIVNEYHRYVSAVRSNYSDNSYVVNWADNTLRDGQRLRSAQNRAERVRQRLAQLDPELAELHRQAVDLTLTAMTNPKDIVGAAAIQNRLLERFKGVLFAKCRGDTRPEYKRISEYLAANSELTRTVVEDGQLTYNSLNDEMVGIRKSDHQSTGPRMAELLRLLEEHIDAITGALDPDKVGVKFSS